MTQILGDVIQYVSASGFGEENKGSSGYVAIAPFGGGEVWLLVYDEDHMETARVVLSKVEASALQAAVRRARNYGRTRG